MIFGKLIAGILGFAVAGPLGAFVGLLIGHSFDRGLSGTLHMGSPEQQQKIQLSFFDTLFELMGQLAKADGRISESEIGQAEQLMTQLGLSAEQRQRAIKLFKRGAASSLEFEQTIAAFNANCGRHQNLKQTLLIYLISLALADSEVHPNERAFLVDVARLLGYTRSQFEHLLQMVLAQQNFSAGAQHPGAGRQDIGAAYRALGVAADCSDKVLKKAYRKLISQHHPDKLIAQGVPDDMLKVATEKAQEIQVAYDLLKKHRS